MCRATSRPWSATWRPRLVPAHDPRSRSRNAPRNRARGHQRFARRSGKPAQARSGRSIAMPEPSSPCTPAANFAAASATWRRTRRWPTRGVVRGVGGEGGSALYPIGRAELGALDIEISVLGGFEPASLADIDVGRTACSSRTAGGAGCCSRRLRRSGDGMPRSSWRRPAARPDSRLTRGPRAARRFIGSKPKCLAKPQCTTGATAHEGSRKLGRRRRAERAPHETQKLILSLLLLLLLFPLSSHFASPGKRPPPPSTMSSGIPILGVPFSRRPCT